jgi:hypothetical protein
LHHFGLTLRAWHKLAQPDQQATRSAGRFVNGGWVMMNKTWCIGWLASLAGLAGCGGDGSRQVAPTACQPQALYAADGGLPAWMTATGDYVYWLEDASGELYRSAKRSGGRELVTEGVVSGWAAIASDAAHLYVAGTDHAIHRLATDGSENIALSDAGDGETNEIQVAGPYVYWDNAKGNPVSHDFEAQVRRAKIDEPGAAEVLWSTGPSVYSTGLATGGGYYFLSVFNWSYPNELQSDGRILRLSAAGDPGVPLVEGLLVPRVYAADDRYVYFSAQNAERDNGLWRVAISGGPAEVLVPPTFEDSVEVGQMLIRGDTVWWGQANRLTPGHLDLHRVSAGGGSAAVASMDDSHHMLGLAGDDENLYFSTSHSYDSLGPAGIWRVGRECPLED